MKIEFSRQSFKNPQIPHFSKIRSVGTEVFRADGQSDS